MVKTSTENVHRHKDSRKLWTTMTEGHAHDVTLPAPPISRAEFDMLVTRVEDIDNRLSLVENPTAPPPVIVPPPSALPPVPAGLASGSLTLQQAATQAGTGATFGVPARAFLETVTPLAGQTIVAYPGAAIDGANTRPYAFILSAAGVTINGFDVRLHKTPQQDGAVRVLAPNAHLVAIHAHDNAGPGLTIRSTDALVEDSELAYNGQAGFHGTGSARVTYRRCHIHHNNPTGAVDGLWEAGAGKITNSTTILFDACEVNDNVGVGLWADINCNDWTVKNCRIHGNTLSGIMFEISTTALIDSNTVWHNGEKDTRGWGWPANILVSSAASATVSNNLVAHGLAGISIITQNRGDKPANSGSNIHVVNNTLCLPSKQDGWYDDWSGGFAGRIDTGNVIYASASPTRDAILNAAGVPLT